jgi:hypothetical protein
MRAIEPEAGFVHVPDASKVWTSVLPPDGAALVHVVPLDVSTLPDVPGATACRADVPLPSSTLFSVNDVAPVPPFATGNVPPVPPFSTGRTPVTPSVKLTFVIVLSDPSMVLFVRVWIAVVDTA